MNAKIDISKNHWRSTGGLSINFNRKLFKLISFVTLFHQNKTIEKYTNDFFDRHYFHRLTII